MHLQQTFLPIGGPMLRSKALYQAQLPSRIMDFAILDLISLTLKIIKGSNRTRMFEGSRVTDAGGDVKQKAIQAGIYGITAVSLGGFLDALYGAGPVTHHRFLIDAVFSGIALFLFSMVLALFKPQYAVAWGLAAAILSWPELSLVFPAIPWNDLHWFARYRSETLTAMLCLSIASLYSVVFLLRLLKMRVRSA